jgi:hypothetical protein
MGTGVAETAVKNVLPMQYVGQDDRTTGRHDNNEPAPASQRRNNVSGVHIEIRLHHRALNVAHVGASNST